MTSSRNASLSSSFSQFFQNMPRPSPGFDDLSGPGGRSQISGKHVARAAQGSLSRPPLFSAPHRSEKRGFDFAGTPLFSEPHRSEKRGFDFLRAPLFSEQRGSEKRGFDFLGAPLFSEHIYIYIHIYTHKFRLPGHASLLCAAPLREERFRLSRHTSLL